MSKCGNVALDIKTYFAGLNQPTHPNLIAFEKPWHGYTYYMAYTPYPYGNGFEENPCIAASNDLMHWEKPVGLINPIATSEELACDELKDSHLLYRKDLDRLEMWYLGRLNGSMADGSSLRYFRKVSSDGRTWSEYEIMYTCTDFNLVSPSVIYDGRYLLWGIRYSKDDIGLYLMTSTDGIHWSKLEKCDVPEAASTTMWHGTVIFADGKYHFVWVGNIGMCRQQIYYADSDDGRHFTAPSVVVTNDTGWDFLYRPCLLKTEDQWYCYYGVIRRDGKWLISMSKGESLDRLSGVTAADLPRVLPLPASNLKLRIKCRALNIMKLFTPRLLLFLPISFAMCLLNISPLVTWLASVCFGFAGSVALIGRKNSVSRGIITGTINACISVFMSEIFQQILLIIKHLLPG